MIIVTGRKGSITGLDVDILILYNVDK